MKIVSVAEMRDLEAAAFATGTSEAELQVRAGAAVAEEIFRLKPSHVVIFVGHGNNGRDGAVAALWLLERGVPVDLVLTPRHAVRPDELRDLRAHDAGVIPCEDVRSMEVALASSEMAVDALAGIGIHGALREPLASLAQRLNAARDRVHIVALDLPSGIDADTGEVPGEAVWAHTTVTLGGVKRGLLRFPAAERVGQLISRDIGIPSEAEEPLPYRVIDENDLRAPARPLDAHKYRFGRVLVIAGTDHFLGAPVLSAGGAARIGAGLVTVASTRDVCLNVAAHLPEVTFTDPSVPLKTYLRSHNAIVIGPGLGRGPEVTRFVASVLEQRSADGAIVIDADGLVALSELESWPTRLGANVVLTPHAGELERLVGHELDRSEADWQRAGRLAREWGCVLVAKGPFTSVASPDGRVDVWPRANPALATGGTGDVLAGITGGLLAQHLAPWDAARLAVGVHAMAAVRIGERGWRTLLASDLLQELPAILTRLR